MCTGVIDGAAVVMQRERLSQITATVNAERWPLRRVTKKKKTGQDMMGSGTTVGEVWQFTAE